MEDAWECFGSDSDEEELDEAPAKETSTAHSGMESIMHLVRSAVVTRGSATRSDSASRAWVGIHTSDTDKLLSAMISQIQNTRLCHFGSEPEHIKYDIVVSASSNIQGVWANKKRIEECRKRLIAGGTAVLSIPFGLQLPELFPPNCWNLATMSSKPLKQQTIISVTSLLTLGNFSSVRLNLNTGWIVEVDSVTKGNAHEQSLLEAVTVSLTSEERHAGMMNEYSINKSIESIREHGLCIIRGLFRKTSALEWAQAAIADVRAAHDILKARHGIDLVGDGKSPRNFYEMSMVRVGNSQIRS